MTTLAPATPYQRPDQDGAYTVATVLLPILGGFVVPLVGWFAGVVMLCAGTGWSATEKWIGTLVGRPSSGCRSGPSPSPGG